MPPARPPQQRYPARPPRDPHRTRLPLAGMIAGGVLVLGGVAAAVILTMHPFSHTNDASTYASSAHRSVPTSSVAATSATGSPVSTSSSSAAAQVTEEQAAQTLNGMLAQSVPDRTAVTRAVTDVETCGPSLNQDSQIFQNAASSRSTLLTDLANMSGASALPAPMIQDLTGAWQASMTADEDFAQWTDDEITHGCTQNYTSNANFAAATGPDDQATTDKKAFVSLWNPIATQYGLTTYAWNQL